MLLQIQTAYPNFDLNTDAVNLWTRFLMDADAEMAFENLNEHIKHNKFAPVIADIVKRNEHIHAKREKERSRLMIQEATEREKNRVQPPWVREGISREEYTKRIIAEGRKIRDAQH